MGARIWTDAEALDQIAAFLGLYNTDPANNPVEERLVGYIDSYVQNTGRSTDTPEGA
jgi:hypothetical protein